MRLASYAALIVLGGCIFCVAPARADHQPALVVPGNPKVPVVLDGYDVSGAVIEGDWGLYRPGQVTPTVFYPFPPAADHWHSRSYFPATGKRPRLGRVEVIPPANRRLPPPAESYHRYWSSPAAPPATITEYPDFVPPPIILAPKLKSLN